jgi:hypothetical protein
MQQQAISGQTQTVTVTAAAAAPVLPAPTTPAVPLMARPPSTAMGFRAGAGDTTFALDGTLPLVKWSTLRREPDGNLSPVQPDEIRAGDAIVLRLEPYADGELSVVERVPDSPTPRVIVATVHVERAKPLDTAPLTMDRPGVRDLLVQFRPQAALGALAGARDAKRLETAAAKEPAASPPPGQTILLRYR